MHGRLARAAHPVRQDVLSPARLERTYSSSPLGKGAVAGHVFGAELPAPDREALVSYVRSL